MAIIFRKASVADADDVSSLVVRLMAEISEQTNNPDINVEPEQTRQCCEKLLKAGCYKALVGYEKGVPVAVSTFVDTYALYAGGKIGIVQEFYVLPEYRSTGIGSQLLENVKRYGAHNGWRCLELCTPPLPEFEKALDFYQRSGLTPVGGRKMRQTLTTV